MFPSSSSASVLVAALVLVLAPERGPDGGAGAHAARILGIFPTASISHQLPFQAVMKALAARGHHVTVISPDPLKEPVANYTDVDLSFSYEYFRQSFTFADMSDMSGITMMKQMTAVMNKITDIQLSSSQVQDFLRYNASQGFDLVFLEWLMYQSYFGVIHAVGSPPIIGILSLGGLFNAYSSIGNPNNPAINPDLLGTFSDSMTFWERLHNTYDYIEMRLFWEWTVLPQQEAQLRKYFGAAPPPVHETEHNMSLLVLNNHWSTDYPRALLPNVVQLSGLHVRERPRPLPPQLLEWLEGAGPAGVVYFSLGSNVMSKDLPRHKRDAVLRALARLPQRVLWKWEEDALPGCPPNVRIGKWLPQQDILAHPNVRLFITQGGLQSFQEAVYHAIPLLGISFFGDQHYNVAKMVSSGVAVRVDFKDLSEETLHAAITQVLEDPGYRERMRRFSAVFREHKTHSLETALWWVEYVLRHDGATHLRPSSLKLAWYQHMLLDVAAAVTASALAAAALAFFAVRALWRAVRPAHSHSHVHARVQALQSRKDQ